ncbi:Ribosomal protein S18 acetylase RimI [Halomicrobium zhouii]|uniref:Ribosomal protein S18 acetylase RimI n=1 Tax=Halomicrobium zhouii TaxID=767519 RepID=A0A1I6LHV8_9EURY|nr:Ribosomal protein S18 acetylase RimI [Halomicrobium zhouii]
MGQLSVRQSEYTIRPYEASDFDGFLDLYAQVFDTDRDREWFDWKYGDNPYVDHVPILVAERDGDLVGARPFFALDVSVGGERRLALQPADAMVHPDHRRQGLFTRMTEAAIETYGDGEPSFFFNFPNHRSTPGNLKLGWKRVTDRSTYYRVQDPSALASGLSAPWSTVAALALRPVVGCHNWLSDRRTETADRVTVERRETVPSATLASLAVPEDRNGIRAWRDAQFYDWRFGNPAWTYDTYVAVDGSDAVAAMVTGTGVSAGIVQTKIVDVLPLPDDGVGGGRTADCLDALLARAVRDNAESDVLIAPATLPRSVAVGRGFRRDDRPPLSRVANPTTHVVRSLTGEWRVDGLDVTDPANWRLTFAEKDSN